MIVVAFYILALFGVGQAATGLTPSGVNNYTAPLGGTALLKCNIQGYQSSDSVQWFKQPTSGSRVLIYQVNGGNVQNIINEARYNNRGTVSAGEFHLEISTVIASDETKYFCDSGSFSIGADLLIYQAPSALTMTYDGSSSPSLTKVPVKHSVSVTCRAPEVSPLPSVNWYISDGTNFTSTSALSSGVGTLGVVRQGSTANYTVSSTLSTKFSSSDEGKTLTCSIDYPDRKGATYTQVTLGAGATSANLLLLAALAILAVYRH